MTTNVVMRLTRDALDVSMSLSSDPVWLDMPRVKARTPLHVRILIKAADRRGDNRDMGSGTPMSTRHAENHWNLEVEGAWSQRLVDVYDLLHVEPCASCSFCIREPGIGRVVILIPSRNHARIVELQNISAMRVFQYLARGLVSAA